MKRLIFGLALLFTVIACSRPVEGTSYPEVDRTDATQVMAAAVATMFTWHPATEASTADAYRRAIPYFTDGYAAKAFEVRGAGGEQWKLWARNGTSVIARAEVLADEHPADHPTSMRRVLSITQTIRGGDAESTIVLTAWVTAVSAGDGWRVDAVEL